MQGWPASGVELLNPVLAEAMVEAGVEGRDLAAVAATTGPGLIGSLLVGVSFAKSAAWGLGKPLRGTAALALAPKKITLGAHVALTLVLTSSSPKAQKLAVDYAVHHVKADGSTSPKVFKGWVAELPPHATLTLTKRHPVKPITTRRTSRCPRLTTRTAHVAPRTTPRETLPIRKRRTAP